MVLRVVVLAWAIFSCGLDSAAAKYLTDAELKALLSRFDRKSIIFFVAKGGPNACGPGCNEWIAAEGEFDVQAGKRFDEFLAALPHRDLPIFFHSTGGDASKARAIAHVLRANRMKAGVARTIPDECRSGVSRRASCRPLVLAKSVTARLVTADAECTSACVYALAGASFRKVAPDARIKIHTGGLKEGTWKREDANFSYKRFFLNMGVDPRLVDLANKTPFERVRAMTRDEIARLGFETRGYFETQWMLDKDASKQFADRFFIRKSVTQPEAAGSIEYRTTKLAIGCPGRWGVPVTYRRELSNGEGTGEVTIRLGSDDLQMHFQKAEKDTEVKFLNVPIDQIRKATEGPAIEFSEAIWLQGELKARVTRFSTAGLSETFQKLVSLCDEHRSPAQALGR